MVSFGNPRRRVPPLPYYRATNRSEGMEKFDNRGGEVEKRISFPSIPRVYLTRIIPRFPPLIFFPTFCTSEILYQTFLPRDEYISGISGNREGDERESNGVLVEFNCGRFAQMRNLFVE